MPNFDITKLSVCTVCIHLLANGEFNDGTDAAEVAGNGMARIWGNDAIHLVPGGGHRDNECDGECDGECDNLGFSWSSCDGCGESLGGDRHAATALIPITS